MWTYDDAGNILSKKEYTYTTGTLGTATSTKTYTYGNEDWGDLLTAYDGHTITHDGIGNPLTDGTWTYTWEHGRELASMTRDDGVNEVTITYTYDANGMRTGKTVTVNTYHTHSYSTSVTAPTCTTGGYTTYTCACGHSYTGAETTATGHSYTSTVVESTCTATGYTVYTCTVCGHSYQDNVTAETGHSYTSTVVAPTCTATGYTLYRCSACGYNYRDNTVPKTGHNGVVLNVVEATCTTRGYTNYLCHTCNTQYMGTYVNALGHDFEISRVGINLVHTCRRCGYTYSEGGTLPPGPVNPILPPITNGTTAEANGTDGSAAPASTNAAERVLESTVTTTYSYVYNGGQLVQETITTAVTENGTTTTTTDVLNYIYDASGPMAVDYNGDTYYYVTNLQGDIVAIMNSSGTSVVTYTYDAWGNHLTTAGTMAETLGEVNALRYRGYVFDTETNLYYLQSRYYSPTMGRFINADAFTSTGQGLLGNNMFAYCKNNAVNGSDPCGTCFHRLDFWNDCEECGGRTFGEKVGEVVSTYVDFQLQQASIQQQILQEQHRIIQGMTQASLELIAESQMLQIESQRQQEAAMRDFLKDRFSTPEKTRNTLTGIAIATDGAALIVGVTSSAAVITVGTASLPLSTAIAGFGMIFHIAAWMIDISVEEG